MGNKMLFNTVSVSLLDNKFANNEKLYYVVNGYTD